MIKKRKYILIGTVIVISILICYLIVKSLFFSMSNLPKGEYLNESVSPEGTYTIKTYLCSGSATSSYSVRGELIINNKKGKSKNIYWNYRTEDAFITWLDDDTVKINGHIIDLPDGKYDWRKDKDKL